MLAVHSLFEPRFSGKHYDIGNRFDFLKTNIETGLKREDIGAELAEDPKRIAAELP